MYDLKMHWVTPESGETKILGVGRNFCKSLRERVEQIERDDCERKRLASEKRREKSWRGEADIFW